jgi:hypothetical protein
MLATEEPIEPRESSLELWKRGPLTCYLIGDPECPILKRITFKVPLIPWKFRLHKFYPNTSDRDTHDHPWWFVTIVLRGGYKDVALDGTVDNMRPGSIRFRPAHHAHKTFAGPKGCTTFVFGPDSFREWGFFPDGGPWMPWKRYMALFGHGMQCND